MERGYGEQPVGFSAYLICSQLLLSFLHFFYSSIPFVTGLVGSVYSISGVLFFFSSYPCFS